MSDSPRVTLGIATYNRDTYLAEAIDSCLEQDYGSLEVLVVIDGSTNADVDAVVSRYADNPRFRAVRHSENRGISAAYDTIVSAGRGELIAMLGDDDVCMPGRIRRQVELFDRFPDTGVVHGDAVVIDAHGAVTGEWRNVDMLPGELVRCFYRNHDYVVDPTRMVHRRVYERVGGYDGRYRVAQDFELWLRAARHFRFRHCDGGPLIKLRRHGDNGSDESQRDAETDEVAMALGEGLERYSLRELEPELDWAVIDPAAAERQALLRLADQVEHRGVPVPTLANQLRVRARAIPDTTATPRNGRRLLMTMFGWNDSGGGTILPRLIAKELARRGWEVSVFHAATAPLPDKPPYFRQVWEEDGVRLVGIHNRPSPIFDLTQPLREIDDPVIRELFRQELESFSPDVVHFHNLHNLGATLIDEAAAHGLRSFFTTHNYWLMCPRAYLLRSNGTICDGPGDGTRCAECTGSHMPSANARRLADVRSRVDSGITRVLAISDAVRDTFVAAGYGPEAIDVVAQAMPHERDIWEQTGRDRRPGRCAVELTVGFIGSAAPHKGPQLLVEAAQRTTSPIRVRIFGELAPDFAQRLRSMDRRGVVEFTGRYSPSELGSLLATVDVAALPSTWWDCANLAARECHAARVPLVVPRLGGLSETVRDGVDGLTFTGLDADDLTRQLDRLADEPGLLERLQAAIEPATAFADHVDELEAYYLDAHAEGIRPTSPSTSQIRWKGDHGLPTSLSIINDEVTRRLDGQVQRVDRNGGSIDPPLVHAADVEVHQEWPPDLIPPPSGRFAAIVPWEFGSIPQRWLQPISDELDELWVPSEFVRQMYLGSGIDPQRVVVIPNGVDLEVFRPAASGPGDPTASAIARPAPTRFLYVGGITPRKGVDLLITAWDHAFAERDDVVLLLKAAMAGGAYGGPNDAVRERAAADRLPRVELIEDDLDAAALADIYRSCDVFVLPYRGEGFAMPVLEAMASGLPVITTAGGPTDEFCPDEACWRIRSTPRPMPIEQLGEFPPVGSPWMLEPDAAHLTELLQLAASTDPASRATMGAAGRAAAERHSWEEIARRYSERITGLLRTQRRRTDVAVEPFPFSEDVRLRILATPAWRADDRLPELLREWTSATTAQTSACLYLLADPADAGEPEQIEARVLAAAETAGVVLDGCADINVLIEPFQTDRDQRLHRSVDAYVRLHDGCAGRARLAAGLGNAVLDPVPGALQELIDTPTPAPTTEEQPHGHLTAHA